MSDVSPLCAQERTSLRPNYRSPRQLPLTPMMVFPIRIENALDVPIERTQHPDAGMHDRPSTFGRQNQRLDCVLPFLVALLGLRQFHDVISRFLECGELATARDRVFERAFPAAISLHTARYPLHSATAQLLVRAFAKYHHGAYREQRCPPPS